MQRFLFVAFVVLGCFTPHVAAFWKKPSNSQKVATVGGQIKSNGIFHNFSNKAPLKSAHAATSSKHVANGQGTSKFPVTVPPHTLSIQQFVYVIMTSIFVTCLIIADVIGVKIFELKLPFPIFGHTSIEHTCGMITFPVTFLLGDVINEYYGPRAAKNTIYIGLGMSILVFLVMNIAQALPYLQKPFNVTPEAFDMIFGSAKLMYVASVIAYLIGQLSDVWLFGVIKRLTKGNYMWLRATGSTVISQMIDSFAVSYIAFSFGKSITNQTPATMSEVMTIAITGYTLKFIMAAALTPILYLIRHVLHRHFDFQPLPADYSD